MCVSAEAELLTVRQTQTHLSSGRSKNELTEWRSLELGVKRREVQIQLKNRTIESLNREIRQLEATERSERAAHQKQVSEFLVQVSNQVVHQDSHLVDMRNQCEAKVAEMDALIQQLKRQSSDCAGTDPSDELLDLWTTDDKDAE